MKKHTNRKKWLSILLVIMMLISLMPVAAFADEDPVPPTEVVTPEIPTTTQTPEIPTTTTPTPTTPETTTTPTTTPETTTTPTTTPETTTTPTTTPETTTQTPGTTTTQTPGTPEIPTTPITPEIPMMAKAAGVGRAAPNKVTLEYPLTMTVELYEQFSEAFSGNVQMHEFKNGIKNNECIDIAKDGVPPEMQQPNHHYVIVNETTNLERVAYVRCDYYQEWLNAQKPQAKATYAYAHEFIVDGQSVYFDKDGQSANGIIEVETDTEEDITLKALSTMPDGYENYKLSSIVVKDSEGKVTQELKDGATEVTIASAIDSAKVVTVTFVYEVAPVQKPTVTILTYYDNVLNNKTEAAEYDVNHPFDLAEVYQATTTYDKKTYKLDLGGYTVNGEAKAIDVEEARKTLTTKPDDKLTLEAGKTYQIHVYYQLASYDVTIEKDYAGGGKVTAGNNEEQATLTYKSGEQVTLTATANAEYCFAGWKVTGVTATEDKNTITFILWEEAVTVKAYFEKTYTVKYYKNEIADANFIGEVFCATNGQNDKYAIAASRADLKEVAKDKDYSAYSFWKEEKGQWVAGDTYTVAVAENRTITYETQQKYEYVFVVKAPEKMYDAQITVTYKDVAGNDLQTEQALDVTFNPDSLVEGKVALGSLIAEQDGALEALLKDDIWVEEEGKAYQLTNKPAENTGIEMTAGADDNYTGAIHLIYAEKHAPIQVVVQYHNESGAELRGKATTTAQYNVNNVEDTARIAYGELKNVAGQRALSDLIAAQLSVSNTTYNLTNAPTAETILAVEYVNDAPVVTIDLLYKAQGAIGPVNPGGDITPGGDGGNTGGGDGGGDYTDGGSSNAVVLPDNNTPLAPAAPITPDNTVVVPAEVVIDENEVPLGEGPQGSSENPKTGAEKAKGLSAIALILAAGALGIEFKRKKA